MDRNLAPCDFKRDLLLSPLHQNADPGACRALHPADHAVLGELHACNVLLPYLQYAVPDLKSGLLGRASGNDLEHDGRVVGHIELDAYAVEIAFKGSDGLLEVCRREIHRMGVELCKGCRQSRIGQEADIHRIDIVVLDGTEQQVELAPRLGRGLDPVVVGYLHGNEAQEHAYYQAEQRSQHKSLIVGIIVHLQNHLSFQLQFRHGGAGQPRP